MSDETPSRYQLTENGWVAEFSDAPKHRGDWLQTYTGLAFYPLDPRPEDVVPEDIAHALSMLCRFGGHIKRFYSVAEHCVLMSHFVPDELALWALLHDATEAYMGDMVRPLKRMMPEYAEAEIRLMATICIRFGLGSVFPAEVKDADNRILLAERAELMNAPQPLPWGFGLEDLEPLPVKITGWSPFDAERRYINRLNELVGASV